MSVDDPAQPLSDADRGDALARLRQAAEDGRLSSTELDARIARVRQARMRGELKGVLSGLDRMPSTPAPPSAVAPTAYVVPSAPVPPGARPDDPLKISAGFSSESRGGRWVLPPYVRIHALGSGVRLDLQHARVVTPVVDVEVVPGLSSVTLVLPEGWAVDVDRLGKGVGGVKVKVPREPAEGCPVLVLRGSIGAGHLKVRRPNRLDLRRARQAL